MNRPFSLPTPHGALHGRLELPAAGATALVLLARLHLAPLDATIAANLAARGYALLSMELLNAQELHFADAAQNVPRLTQRLVDLLDQIRHDPEIGDLPLAIYASGDATPAALRAASQRDWQVRALACHNGFIDRAGMQAVELLLAPLLMLFDATEAVAHHAYQRAAPRLQTIHEAHLLNYGEDPVLCVQAWLGLHL